MRESVTAVLKYQEEIFIIKRQDYLSVFPGYHSFPGGKVDKNESDKDLGAPFSTYDNKVMNALVREVKEELNFELNHSNIKELKYLGIAITPEFNPYRFKNYYYLIELTERINFNYDDGEIEKGYWAKPSDLFKEYKNAEMLAVPPTVAILNELASNPNPKGDCDFNLKYSPPIEVPMIESVCGVRQFLPLSNTFPPANRTNSFLIGDEGAKQVLIDPSPKDDKELEKFFKTLEKFKVDEIFLTHHHPDHHERSTIMARHYNVPMSMSEDSHKRILKKWGDDYFKDIKIIIKKDADILTTSTGEDVFLVSVPGHDEGQLAPTHKSLKWMIVSDLIQTVGTVTIPDEEGDMAKYFNSLQKVINMNPKVIYPSHGIALGGINKLEMTLKHRQMREEQIKELYKQGKSEQEILEDVYQGLESRLHKYALETIRSHLKKITSES